MKVDNILEKKVLNYSLVAGAVLAGSSSVSAQVIYTNPADQSGTAQVFNIDFDGNTENEVVIRFGPQSGVAASDIRVSGTTGMLLVANLDAYGGFSNWYGRALSAGVTIGPPTTGGATSGFSNGAGAQVLIYSSQGEWVNASSKYLGVKFLIGSDTHYGWVRMSISGTNNFNATLFDYAYESTPDLGIQAGSQTSLPVELTSFKADVQEGTVVLNWVTATEVNNYGFEIERKVSSEEWENIGFQKGQGTSNSSFEYSFSDNDLAGVDSASYRLKQIDNDGAFVYSKILTVDLASITAIEDQEIEYNFGLSQNYPNPFNPSTTIKFTLPESDIVKLVVYNSLGEEVKTLVSQEMSAGEHSINFDASDLSSGFYAYRINVGEKYSTTKKMLLIK